MTLLPRLTLSAALLLATVACRESSAASGDAAVGRSGIAEHDHPKPGRAADGGPFPASVDAGPSPPDAAVAPTDPRPSHDSGIVDRDATTEPPSSEPRRDAGAPDAAHEPDTDPDPDPDPDPAPDPDSDPVPDPDPDPGPSPLANPLSITTQQREALVQLPFAVRSLVADPLRARFYALTDTLDPLLPSRLAIIDPANLSAVQHVELAGDPGPLAISDDASTLWVGLRGAQSVVELDLTTGVPVLRHTHALASGPESAVPQQIVALPSAPRSAVVSTGQYLLFIRDGAVLGARVDVEESGAPSPAVRITAGPPGYFFALAEGGPLYRMRVASGGIAVEGAIASLFGEPVYDRDGFLFTSAGSVLDVSDVQAPQPRPNVQLDGAVWPRPASPDLLMISIDSRRIRLRNIDSRDSLQKGVRTLAQLPGLLTYAAPVRDVACLEPDTLGFVVKDYGRLAGTLFLHRSASLFTPPAPTRTATERGGLFEFPVSATALVADPARRVFYAVVDGRADEWTGQLVTIDPATMAITAHATAGSLPTAIAISDDASTAWLGLSGTPHVRRVDLRSGTPVPGQLYPVPLEFGVAVSIALLPSTTDSLAMSVRSWVSRRISAVAIMDADTGDARASQQNGTFLPEPLIAGPPGYLFGFDNRDSEAFYTFTVGSSGVTSRTAFQDVVRGLSKTLVYDRDGYVYATSGDIVDVRNPLAPVHVGRLPFEGAVWPQPGTPVALMVSHYVSSDPFQLRTFNSRTLSQFRVREIGPAEYHDYVSQVAVVEPDLLAFIAVIKERSFVYVLKDPALLPP